MYSAGVMLMQEEEGEAGGAIGDRLPAASEESDLESIRRQRRRAAFSQNRVCEWAGVDVFVF